MFLQSSILHKKSSTHLSLQGLWELVQAIVQYLPDYLECKHKEKETL